MPQLKDDHPRRHHYLFAHRELLGVARRFAGNLTELSAMGRLDDALIRTWDRIGETLPATDRVPHGGLAATMHNGDRQVLLVTMPPAEHAAEAHLVAIVLNEGQLAVHNGPDPQRLLSWRAVGPACSRRSSRKNAEGSLVLTAPMREGPKVPPWAGGSPETLQVLPANRYPARSSPATVPKRDGVRRPPPGPPGGRGRLA